ncbi:uncharacterized oxidoreductase YrbE [Arthrobacter sp. Hiyo8]|nr:uncharacterized oxidoreductase YrbE [Arthrobacter sp. Hiyo8]
MATVISQHRFDPASRVVDEARRAGRFGTLTSAVASVSWWRSQGYYDSGAWRGTWAMDGGGAIMNQGVHTVDLLLWFLGRPLEISAKTALLAHEGVEVEDTAVATVTFESGALAVLHATTAAYPGLTVRLQVMGSKGSAVIDNDDLAYFHASDAADPSESSAMGILGGGNQAAVELAKYPDDTVEALDPTVYPAGHVRQYRDIVAAIRKDARGRYRPGRRDRLGHGARPVCLGNPGPAGADRRCHSGQVQQRGGPYRRAASHPDAREEVSA